MERQDGFLERAAERLDLPAEAVGAPRIELVGRHQLRVENHRGILAYGGEEVLIAAGRLVVHVVGEGLELRTMTAGELYISGTIFSVGLE